MADDRIGAIYVPADSAEIRDQILRDLRLAAIDTGLAEPPTQPGTDWYLLATAVSNTALAGFANVAISDSDSDVLTATGDALEDERIARGLPEVAKAGSTGKIVIQATGATTILNGQAVQLPNGLRAEVVGNYIGAVDEDEVSIQSIDTGEQTNFPAGTEVTFLSPPANLLETATVSDGEPLTGGTDVENDERKRDRIINAIQNRPGGGNWGHVREIAFNSLGTVSDCFVYQALGGPASGKCVPVRKFDRVNRSFTRALSATALATVRDAIQTELPSPSEIVVQSPVDEPTDIALEVTLPDSALSGGNGQGWIDAQPWPPLDGSDTRVLVTTGTSGTTVVVTASTTTAPVDTQTTIAWWSPVDRRFYLAEVVAHVDASPTWTLTTNIPLVDSSGAGPSIGDYISPAARNIQTYGDAWLDLFDAIGPGENTTATGISPRAKRHPFISDGPASDLGTKTYAEWAGRFDEITDFGETYASTNTPTVPALLDTAPNILNPRHFGIYQK